MTSSRAPRVRALSIHAGYRCRNTGVCCSSGWDIAVEPAAEARLRAALRARILRPPTPPPPDRARADVAFRPVSGLPHGARVVLARDAAGRCVFLESDAQGGRCAIHRSLGEEALPSPCRQFPRVVTLTPLGVSVSLSHWCPTAASLLFDPAPRGSALGIVEDPPAFPPAWLWEGLDARDAPPPLLRPGVLMDWPSLERWERFAVSELGDDGRAPEKALDALADLAESARAWKPDEGPFDAHFEALSSRGATSTPGEGPAVPARPVRMARGKALGVTNAWSLVADCIPHRSLLPAAPRGVEEADACWVDPAWPALGWAIRRWLASKAFASWLVLQGEGLRTAVLGLRVALCVLRAEAARGCADAGRTLDAFLLMEAVRRADLLLVHLADPEALARRLSRCEAPARPAGGVVGT